MLSLKKFRLIFSILALVLMASSLFAKGKSYTMICQGGGSMYANVLNAEYSSYRIYFRKSKNAGTVRAPGAGECAWMDRPISNKEPSVLHYYEKTNPVYNYRVSKSSVRITKFSKKNTGRLLQRIYRGQKFFVQVRKDKYGFKITKFGL